MLQSAGRIASCLSFSSERKTKLKVNGDYIEIHAPAHIDFILIHPWSNMKTSKDFEGYFIIRNKAFLSGYQKAYALNL